MAERRMFAKTIIDSDAFLDMPVSARLLYYDLGMRADDDGFVNAPKKIIRIVGASDDDIKLLCAKKFIIPFESGIVVIKHWKIHNFIAKDRYSETKYKDEKAVLSLDENKSYTLSTNCIQPVNELDTQVRLGKVRLGKVNKNIVGQPDSAIVKKVIEYLNGKLNTKYKHTSSKNKTLINTRINEGFTYDDFVTVIDKKYNEWFNSDMAKFLRPETLFSNKFEGYLNQVDKGGSTDGTKPNVIECSGEILNLSNAFTKV